MSYKHKWKKPKYIPPKGKTEILRESIAANPALDGKAIIDHPSKGPILVDQ